MRLRHVVATVTATVAMIGLVIVGTAGSASAGIPGAARSNIVISELFDSFGSTYAGAAAPTAPRAAAGQIR